MKDTVTTAVKLLSDGVYHEQEIRSAYFPVNDTMQVTYFKNSIDNIQCVLYLQSVLDVVDSLNTPSDSANIINELKEKNAVLLINNRQVELESAIRDASLMLPTYIGHTTQNGSDYLLIRMNLVSSMGGDYWYNLLLKLNKNREVIGQQGVETNGELAGEKLKDYLK
ncbi:hypothetical protein DF182_06175 [Chitinophaga flava]|uniref:Uncharacterized protein n=2 Tax=Chitinophaga flava TaxID=2259036 RepID=A0A365Y1R4_9BACT|nr:hypothetical protein DF182_06175 [Chitinophaga flava]